MIKRSKYVMIAFSLILLIGLYGLTFKVAASESDAEDFSWDAVSIFTETSTEETTTEETTTEEIRTGLYTENGNIYYYNEKGHLVKGWVKVNGRKYYFNKKTYQATIGLKKIKSAKYYFNSKGRMVTQKWKTIDGKKYYFGKNGKAKTGYCKIDGVRYYFNSNGVLQKNKIVGDKKTGYNYVDASGKVVTTSSVKLAVQFIIDNTDEDWSNSKKLKACYDYLWKKVTYVRTYGIPGASDLNDYAAYMLKYKKGNCFKYAASFAVIAKVLGYEARVCVGKISARNGGMTAHGWTQVKVNGYWYICDPDMQMNYPSINVYMVSESRYPYTHVCNNRYTLKISDGKATWVK